MTTQTRKRIVSLSDPDGPEPDADDLSEVIEDPDPMIWVSVDLAAMVTGRHPEALRRWIREGVLPAKRASAAPRAPYWIRWVDLALLADRPRKPGSGRRPG